MPRPNPRRPRPWTTRRSDGEWFVLRRDDPTRRIPADSLEHAKRLAAILNAAAEVGGTERLAAFRLACRTLFGVDTTEGE